MIVERDSGQHGDIDPVLIMIVYKGGQFRIEAVDTLHNEDGVVVHPQPATLINSLAGLEIE